MTTGAVNHEFKYGAGYRKADVTTQSHYGGNGIITNDAYTQVADGSANTFIFVADRASGVGYSETNKTAFAQDTMTSGAFTFNVGVHYDNQRGETTQVNVLANPFVPTVLPGLTTVAAKNPFTWSTVSPRLGAVPDGRRPARSAGARGSAAHDHGGPRRRRDAVTDLP